MVFCYPVLTVRRMVITVTEGCTLKKSQLVLQKSHTGKVKDTLVLTFACGKYHFNELDLGEIVGIPLILDMGQCNNAYSAIKVALALVLSCVEDLYP